MKSKSLIALFSLLLAVSVQAKLKVFILAGQSNMQGAGQVNINPKSHTQGKGSLEYLMNDPKTAAKFAHLKDKNGEWVVRKDVWIRYDDRQDGLRPGFGARNTTIGPELGFGTIVGDAVEEPVLLIKTCWGGKSIMVDFRPPQFRHAAQGHDGKDVEGDATSRTQDRHERCGSKGRILLPRNVNRSSPDLEGPEKILPCL
ncbi:sialate O-acetylesterase [Verrucomicrobia bacterium]|nr:sialate O-acetylesterase [Verrucomicrobiota bacterium]